MKSLRCSRHCMAHLDSSISFKGVISDSSRYQSEVSECRAHSSHYWRVKLLSIKELEALVREYTDNDIQDRRTAKTSGNMKSFDIPLFGLLLLFSVQLTGALPLQNTALTTEDMDVLKVSRTSGIREEYLLNNACPTEH